MWKKMKTKEVLAIGIVAILVCSVGLVTAQDQSKTVAGKDQTPPGYNPEEFTIFETGEALSIEELEVESEQLLDSFNQQFGDQLPPVYLGVPHTVLPEGDKIVAYGFRVLPNGETIGYTGICAEDCQEFSDTIARAEEWKETMLPLKTEAATMAPLNSQPARITTHTTDKEYNKASGYAEDYGYAEITTSWYWDNYESDNDHDYFYAKSVVDTDPGYHLYQSGWQNNEFRITHDWLYTIGGSTPHLPDVNMVEHPPTTTSGETTVGITISSEAMASESGGSIGVGAALHWFTKIPEWKVLDDSHPGSELGGWKEVFRYGSDCAKHNYQFKPGSDAYCTQSTARNGNTYVVSCSKISCEDGWKKGSSTGPSGYNAFGHFCSVRWNNGYVKV
ncbi:MAG TPA: hypothetical protein C5S37_09545 [Methanophagales archaeon]|nr:hypothetical protein [Methanophagales archaeon]